MCDPVTLTAIAMGVTATAGGVSAYSSYKQGAATKKYYDYMADQSRIEGESVYKAGKKQSELVQESAKQEGKRHKIGTAELASTQRAAMVANGMDLSSVTAQDIASDSMSKAKLDEISMRYNADVKSWSIMEDSKYKRWSANVQADQYGYAGKSAKKAGKMEAFNTLLSTAASVASMSTGLLKPKGVSPKQMEDYVAGGKKTW